MIFISPYNLFDFVLTRPACIKQGRMLGSKALSKPEPPMPLLRDYKLHYTHEYSLGAIPTYAKVWKEKVRLVGGLALKEVKEGFTDY